MVQFLHTNFESRGIYIKQIRQMCHEQKNQWKKIYRCVVRRRQQGLTRRFESHRRYFGYNQNPFRRNKNNKREETYLSGYEPTNNRG